MEWGLTAFLIGVAGSFFIPYSGDPFYIYLVLLVAVCGSILSWHAKGFRVPCSVLVWCLVGVVRVFIGDVFSHEPYSFESNQQTVSGDIIREPLIRGAQQGLIVRTHKEETSQGMTFLAWTSLFPLHHQWEQVRVSCAFMPLDESRHRSVDATCRYASVTTTGVGGNGILRSLSELKLWLSNLIEHTLPQPHSGLFGSMIFGARTTLSRHLVDVFNTTGLTHIVAVSGYNITLLIGILSTTLLSFGAHRKKLPVFLGVGIVFFTLFTGGSAATIRASSMGYLFVIAQWFGRRAKGVRLLLFSAVGMTAIDPEIIFDLGFQLSFLATCGLFAGSSLFNTIRVPYIPLFIQNVALQTISAMLFTTPLIFLTFGTVSLVALLANILIVPILPAIMMYGMAWMGVAFVVDSIVRFGIVWAEPIRSIAGWPLWFLLEYVIRCVESLSRIPFASVSFQITTVHWVSVFGVYSILVPLFILFQRKRRLYLKI